MTNLSWTSSWSVALYAPLAKGWYRPQACAIGRLLIRQPDLLAMVLRDLCEGDGEHVERNLIALREAIRNGAATDIASVFPMLDQNLIVEDRIKAVSVLLLDLASSDIQHESSRLVVWMEPLVRQYPHQLIPALAAFSADSPIGHDIVLSLLASLPEGQRINLIHDIVRLVSQKSVEHLADVLAKYLHQAPPNRSTQLARIAFYKVRGVSSPAICSELVNLALHSGRDVSLAAAKALVFFASTETPPAFSHMLSLLHSPIEGVRTDGLDALIRQQTLSTDDLASVCETLLDEESNAVLLRLFNLMAQWMRRNTMAPEIVIRMLGTLCRRLVQIGEIESGVARSLLLALKVVAQIAEVEVPTDFSQWIQAFFWKVDLRAIRDGESEGIDLLCAVTRGDSTFLERLVESVPKLIDQGTYVPVQNLRALAFAIQRVQGINSALLNSILQSPWCPRRVENIILESQRA